MSTKRPLLEIETVEGFEEGNDLRRAILRDFGEAALERFIAYGIEVDMPDETLNFEGYQFDNGRIRGTHYEFRFEESVRGCSVNGSIDFLEVSYSTYNTDIEFILDLNPQGENRYLRLKLGSM